MTEVIDWRTCKDPDEKRHAYYASREWGKLKKAVRKRSGGLCERCYANPMQQVHHLSYIRLYAEELTDLQAVCRGCHEFNHGISDVDPLWGAPVVCCGKKVESIYLAGTCWPNFLENTPDGELENWRRQITDAYFVDHKTGWPGDKDQIVKLHGGKRLAYCGPHIYYDHGACVISPHGTCPDATSTLALASTGLRHAEVIFAWIDRPDCYGTIAEIGLAKGLGTHSDREKVIVIAGPQKFKDMWFVYEMADDTLLGNTTPKLALEYFIK